MLAQAPLEKEDAMPNSSPLVRSFGALRAHTAGVFRTRMHFLGGATAPLGAQAGLGAFSFR